MPWKPSNTAVFRPKSRHSAHRHSTPHLRAPVCPVTVHHRFRHENAPRNAPRAQRRPSASRPWYRSRRPSVALGRRHLGVAPAEREVVPLECVRNDLPRRHPYRHARVGVQNLVNRQRDMRHRRRVQLIHLARPAALIDEFLEHLDARAVPQQLARREHVPPQGHAVLARAVVVGVGRGFLIRHQAAAGHVNRAAPPPPYTPASAGDMPYRFPTASCGAMLMRPRRAGSHDARWIAGAVLPGSRL
jgi:hypothetical protein